MKDIKQKVIRTYPSGWTNATTKLEKALAQGYKMVHITSLPEGITEYIIEKEAEKAWNNREEE